jgi:membrane-associated phospholipid phosphatase
MILTQGLAVLLVIWLTAHLATRGSRGLRALLGWRPWVLMARNAAGFLLVSILYTHWKAALARFAVKRHDALLMAADRALVLGRWPHKLLWSLIPPTNPVAHILMDNAYKWFFVIVLFSFFVCFVRADFLRFTRYTMALVFTYYLGLVGYYLVPAYGPIFAYPQLFTKLPLSWVAEVHAVLTTSTLAVISAPGQAFLLPFAYIAAFPSLHVAHTLQAAHFVGSRTKLGLALWVYLVIMTLSTLYFGMHYMVDWPAGIILGWAVIKIVGRLTRSGMPTEEKGIRLAATSTALTVHRRPGWMVRWSALKETLG